MSLVNLTCYADTMCIYQCDVMDPIVPELDRLLMFTRHDSVRLLCLHSQYIQYCRMTFSLKSRENEVMGGRRNRLV